MTVCILYGGNSSEREVSINTAKSIFHSICKDYEIIMHDFRGNYDLLYKAIKNIDLVFIALHGGDGEDGTIQKYLESKNIKFTGSNSEASKIAMNKNLSKILCRKNKISTPNWELLLNSNKIELFIDKIYNNWTNGGVVIKPNNEGSSVGVTIIKKIKKEKLLMALKKAFKVSKKIMVEKYIKGRELTVSILNNRVLPIVEIEPKGDYYDYRSKYTQFQSDYIVPANINRNTKELLSAYSLKIHKLIGCGVYSRLDFRLSEHGEVYFLELNTLPGLTDTSLFPKSAESFGISYKSLICRIIDLARR